MTKFYANIIDLSEVPELIFKSVMWDWFDREDIISNKDGVWVRIVGKNDEIVRARIVALENVKKIKHGSGVRIKEKG